MWILSGLNLVICHWPTSIQSEANVMHELFVPTSGLLTVLCEVNIPMGKAVCESHTLYS